MNSDANMGSFFFGMQFLSLDQAVSDQKSNSAPTDVSAGDAFVSNSPFECDVEATDLSGCARSDAVFG